MMNDDNEDDDNSIYHNSDNQNNLNYYSDNSDNSGNYVSLGKRKKHQQLQVHLRELLL